MAYSRFSFLLIPVFLFALSMSAVAAERDSVRVYYHDGITVHAKKQNISRAEFPAEKGSLGDVLEKNGFSVIRKGVFLAQDIYADGMKKSDIPVVVDDERYQCACPNRMDAPVSRISPLDIESVELDKSSSNLQAGLGGVVLVRRSEPQDSLRYRGSLTQYMGSFDATDAAFQIEKNSHRISLRYVEGEPYENGDGKSFRDLYNYRENTPYRFGEASLMGKSGPWKYTASFMYSEDISFPYLLMDERNSLVYNASLSYDDYKLYVNYTDHTMDNGLRTGYSTMQMRTDATNLTVGLKSDFFEAFYRRWNADNSIRNRMASIQNNMIPDVNLYAFSVQKKADCNGISVAGKAGLSWYHIGNEDVLPYLRTVHPGADDDRLFPTFGLSLSHSAPLSKSLSLGAMLDVASEAPEAESLFINVRKMPNTVWTSGNPELDQPLRATLRTSLSSDWAKLELFGSYIFNYVTIDNATVGTQRYLTYSNIDALLAGASLELKYKWLDVSASYTWGNNETDNRPLIEILPLRITTTLTTPEFSGLKLYVRHKYEHSQNRVDPELMETPTGSWNTIDAGIMGRYKGLSCSLDVENIGDASYYRHLSYLRDPFASGYRVWEPGISASLNIRYAFN